MAIAVNERVATVTESNKVFGDVIRRIIIYVMNGEEIFRSADTTGVLVTIEDGLPCLLPSGEAIF